MCAGLAICLAIWGIGLVRLILGLSFLPELAAMIVLVFGLTLMRQHSMATDKDNEGFDLPPAPSQAAKASPKLRVSNL